MIGELRNRLTHLLAVSKNRCGKKLRLLHLQASKTSLNFLKWLDDELSYLVDERVLLINTLVGRSRRQMHHARLPSLL
ncbi:hypothetical protein IMY05_004G0039400 [Salix suchowensis]|nr:hypothetical protein IMY05_004G0039400 [Salix suchowensis]